MSETVLDQPRTASEPPRIPGFARREVFALSGLVALAHLAVSFTPGYWIDEAYMEAIGRYHLAWGSVDQPPLTMAIAWLMDRIAPGSLVAMRLPAIIVTALGVALAALIAQELGGDRRAQLLTAGAQATAPWTVLSGHWLTTYTLEPTAWLLLFWLVVRWVRVRDDRLLLAVGVTAGVTAEIKFQVLALCAVMVVCVLVLGPRAMLTRPLLWVGAVLGLAIAAPTLVWQLDHGFPQLAMAGQIASESALNGGRPGIALTLLVFAGVAGTGLVCYGLYRLARVPELREYRFLGATFVVLWIAFTVSQGHGYYLIGMYAPLAAVGAVGLQRRREAGRTGRRWTVWPVYALSAAVAVAALVVSFVWTTSAGDKIIANRTAASFRALPADQRAHTAIMTDSYIIASDIDSRARELGIPPTYSGNRAYADYPAPTAAQDTVLFIGSTPRSRPDVLSPYFSGVRPLGHGQFLLTGRRAPWPVIWPTLRSLKVDLPQAR
jgi:hypothetical protein